MVPHDAESAPISMGEKITDVVQPRHAIHSTECPHSIQVHEGVNQAFASSVQGSTFNYKRQTSGRGVGRPPKIRCFWESRNQVALRPIGLLSN